MKKKLLSVCFILAALLSLMTVTAFAVDWPVSTTSELEDAISGASPRDTIKLGKDTSVNSDIIIDKELTIDLSGDGSEAWHLLLGDWSIVVEENAKLTIQGGKISGTGNQTIVVKNATLTVNGTTVINTKSGGIGVSIAETTGGELTLESGTIQAASGCAISQSVYGRIYINGGMVTGMAGIVADNGIITVGGRSGTPVIKATGNGSYRGTAAGITLARNELIELTITEGSILSDRAEAIAYLTNTGSYATINITGGLFSSNVQSFLSPGGGYGTIPAGSYYLVVPVVNGALTPSQEALVVHANGDAPEVFDSFDNAVGAVKDYRPEENVTGTDTIYLVKDATPSSSISETKRFTLVLGDCTMDSLSIGTDMTIGGSMTGGSITISDDGVTINGGTVTGTLKIGGNEVAIGGSMTGGSIMLNDNGVTINGGTITGSTGSAVEVKGGTVTINGTEIKDATTNGVLVTSGTLNTSSVIISGSENGINVSDGGAAIITGGTITGTTNGINISGGSLTVENGSISAPTALNIAGATFASDAIKVNGGTFTGTGDTGKAVDVVTNGPSGFIYGGRFITENGDRYLLPKEYRAPQRMQKSDGTVVAVDGEVFEVTFRANTGGPNNDDGKFADDSVSKKVQVVEDHTIAIEDIPEEPILDGYDFDGWYTAVTGGQKFNFDEWTIGGDIEIFAQWKQIFTITFEAGEKGQFTRNKVPADSTTTRPVVVGQKLEDWPADPVPRPGFEEYDFNDWYIRSGPPYTYEKFDRDQTITGDITLYALWGYAITFNPTYGEFGEDVDTELDGTAKKITENINGNEVLTVENWPIPTRDDYDFIGWFEGETCKEEEAGTDPDEEVQCDPVTAPTEGNPTEFTEPTALHAHWSDKASVTLEANRELLVAGTRVAINLTADGAKFIGSVTPDMVTLEFYPGGDGSAAETVNCTVDRRSETLVRITLTPPNKVGTLVITIDKDAFVESIRDNDPTPSVSIPVVYEITFDPGEGSFDGDKLEPLELETDGSLKLYTDISGKLSAEDLEKATEARVPPDDTDHKFGGWYYATEEVDDDGNRIFDEVTKDTVFEKSTEVTARWGFKIVFNFRDQTPPQTLYTDGDKILRSEWPNPTTFTAQNGVNYQFIGWYEGDQYGNCKEEYDVPETENKFTVDDPFTKDTELHAHWNTMITITFDANGGKFTVTADDGTVTTPETTTREIVEGSTLDPDILDGDIDSLIPRPGYTFDCWTTRKIEVGAVVRDADKVTDQTEFKASTTIYAYWVETPSEVGVTFELGDEGWFKDNTTSKTLPTNKDTGRLEKWPDIPTHKDGCEFLGWYDANGTLIAKEKDEKYYFAQATTLYARWSYVITFDPNGGEFTSAEKVDDDGYTTRKTNGDFLLTEWPTEPIHEEDLVFAGWYTAKVGGTAVTKETEFKNGNCTVYAQWQDGVKLTASPTEVLADKSSGDDVEKAPVKITLSVEGANAKFKDSTAVADDVFETYFRLTFKPEDADTVPTIDKVERNSAGQVVVTLSSAPSEAGTLTIWVKPEAVDAKLVKELSVDIAVKEPLPSYTIEFDPNGGTFAASGDDKVPNPTVKTNEFGKLPAGFQTTVGTPTREGYVFDGWYTAASGGDKVDENTVFSKKSTVYAHWTREKYTITFDANRGKFADGSTSTELKTGENGTLSSLPTAPTRDGFAFNGWFTEAQDGTQVTTSTVFTGNATVYAHWKLAPDELDPSGPGTSDPGDSDMIYAIQINGGRNGTVTVDPRSAKAGTTVTVTIAPDTDYEVGRVTIRQTDGTPVSPRGSGNWYTFTMPSSNVIVTVEFELQALYNNYIPPQAPTQAQTAAQSLLPTSVFTPLTRRPSIVMRDVPTTSWAYQAAQWAYQNGYLDLSIDGTFQLGNTVSHIQLWKIMARWQGERALDDNSVTLWARKTGAYGIGAATSAMTRQNMVEYLYQCYFLMGGNISVSGNLTQYHDSHLVTSASAKNAWIWAVDKGIISGTPDGFLNPNGVLSRGEFASILMRLCQKG